MTALDDAITSLGDGGALTALLRIRTRASPRRGARALSPGGQAAAVPLLAAASLAFGVSYGLAAL